MPYLPSETKRPGFTLVEILVVVPIVILVIAVLIGFLVTLTGDALMSRERSSMVYTTQDALHQIERDIRISTGFLSTTGSLPSPQGSNQATAAFSSPSTQLILRQYATIGSPYDSDRKLAYYANEPNPCGSYHEYNNVASVMVIYFVDNGDLRKRTINQVPNNSVCDGGSLLPLSTQLWQINSCKAAVDTGTCQTYDSILATDVDNFSISYYILPSSSIAVGSSQVPAATTARVSLDISKEVANQDIEHGASIRATRLNVSN